MRRVRRVGSNALEARDVNESAVVRTVSLRGDRLDRLKLRFRMQKAFVAAGNVVVHFNSEHAIFLRAADDLVSIPGAQTVGPNADVVGPIPSRRLPGSWKQYQQQRAR